MVWNSCGAMLIPGLGIERVTPHNETDNYSGALDDETAN